MPQKLDLILRSDPKGRVSKDAQAKIGDVFLEWVQHLKWGQYIFFSLRPRRLPQEISKNIYCPHFPLSPFSPVPIFPVPIFPGSPFLRTTSAEWQNEKTFSSSARNYWLFNSIRGISWSKTESKITEIPKFHGSINVTSFGNEEVISFLTTNDGRIVFLKATVDASVSTTDQFERVEKEDIDIDRIASGKFSGMPLQLLNEEGKLAFIQFHFSDRNILAYSAGGTGIVTVGVTGFFELAHTFHGGPSTMFHLKEIDAPLEFRLDALNKQGGT